MITSLELRKGIRAKFTWPGCYDIVGHTDDGGLLCCDCMKREYRLIAWSRRFNVSDGWKVIGLIANDQLESGETCDHCNRWLDAYNDQETSYDEDQENG